MPRRCKRVCRSVPWRNPRRPYSPWPTVDSVNVAPNADWTGERGRAVVRGGRTQGVRTREDEMSSPRTPPSFSIPSPPKFAGACDDWSEELPVWHPRQPEPVEAARPPEREDSAEASGATWLIDREHVGTPPPREAPGRRSRRITLLVGGGFVFLLAIGIAAAPGGAVRTIRSFSLESPPSSTVPAVPRVPVDPGLFLQSHPRAFELGRAGYQSARCRAKASLDEKPSNCCEQEKQDSGAGTRACGKKREEPRDGELGARLR